MACTPQTSIKEVARIMIENRYSGLPVVEGDAVTGVVTENDLLRMETPLHLPAVVGFLGAAVYLDNPLDGDEVEKQVKEFLAREVGEIMDRDFPTVSEDLEVRELAELMIKENLSLVPVVNERNVLSGVVTRLDVIKVLAQ